MALRRSTILRDLQSLLDRRVATTPQPLPGDHVPVTHTLYEGHLKGIASVVAGIDLHPQRLASTSLMTF
ncbi:hypothetical protein NMY22_g13718 [Coprinellus aureogranulatus]|nr:hypothetical protein NMY22_g13718 [Coprinellus aureogranulatus]